jgi:predicted metal-dependent hydrolase
VAGFIGQEVTHGREHRELNRRLQEMGYPTHRVARFVKWSLADAEKRVPAKLRLSYTAALEHYTATIAECLLRKPEAQALLGDTEVRSILLWHALEESEHKAVAFDAYRAVGGTERMRIWGFRIMTVGLLGLVRSSDRTTTTGSEVTGCPARATPGSRWPAWPATPARSAWAR